MTNTKNRFTFVVLKFKKPKNRTGQPDKKTANKKMKNFSVFEKLMLSWTAVLGAGIVILAIGLLIN